MLFDVLLYMCASLGFLIHYVIPQLRKEMPWLWCSHPLLPSHERGLFEVKGKLSNAGKHKDIIAPQVVSAL